MTQSILEAGMIEMKGKWSGWYDAPTPFGRKQFTLVILEVRHKGN